MTRSADSRRADKPRKRGSILKTMFLAALLALAWLFRDCLGLGLGIGEDGTPGRDAAPAVVHEDAQGAPGGDARSPVVFQDCELVLDARGLTVDGKAESLEDAVRTCRRAGRAHLRVTGDARTGTYRELMAALERAGVPVAEDAWPGGRP